MTATHISGANEPALAVDDLHVSFSTADGELDAVRGVSYTVAHGEALGIVGESGSGKSVTSLAVMGLLARNASVRGSAKVMGEQVIGLGDQAISAIRGRRIAMVLQDPLSSLTPVHTVGRQVAEALRVHQPLSRGAARRRAVELLGAVGIPDPARRVDTYPHELSGGMRQRIVIAIAMANDPDVIIADEPTTALDVTVQAQVLDALTAARQATGAALVLITHDLGVIAGQVERVAVMYAGRIVEEAAVDDLFLTPRMPYTVGLLGSLPRLDQPRGGRLTPIVGVPPSMLTLPPGCPFAPRCPLADSACEIEPDLVRLGAGEHRSACHHTDRLVAAGAREVFAPTATDDALPSDMEGLEQP